MKIDYTAAKKRFSQFAETLQKYDTFLRLAWERQAWEPTEDSTPPPLVRCYLIARPQNQGKGPLPPLVIATLYADGGYDIYPQNPSILQMDDFAALTGLDAAEYHPAQAKAEGA